MKHQDMAIGVACGLVIGVVATLLLAPASGSETRRKLRYERDHTVETARRKVRRAMARLRREQPVEEPVAAEAEEELAFSGA
jgi:gas vesicle protein